MSTADVTRVPERREERAVRSWASEGKQADPAVTDGLMRVPQRGPGACSHDPSAAVDAAWAVFGCLSRRRTIANGADSDTIRTPAPHIHMSGHGRDGGGVELRAPGNLYFLPHEVDG